MRNSPTHLPFSPNRQAAAALATKALLGLAIVSALLLSAMYLAAVGPYWKITPDSVSYVVAGVSLAAGEGYTVWGQPAVPFPPMTSVVFTIPSMLFPNSYVALNATTTIAALLSLALCFALLGKRAGYLGAAAIVVLSSASISMFQQSTFLLSDVIYLLFSLLALIAADYVSSTESNWKSSVLLGAVVLMACMTRTIGLALVLAIISHGFVLAVRQESKLNRRVLACMLVVALLVGLWEYRNLVLGESFFKLFLQNEPYVDASGYASLVGMTEKFLNNLGDYASIGALLTNGMLERLQTTHMSLGRAALVVVCLLPCVGLVVSLRRGITVTALYCIVYLVGIGLYHPYIESRWFFPLLPLLFYYAYVGIVHMLKAVSAPVRPVVTAATCIVLAVYIAQYFQSGTAYMRWTIRQEHTSAFGTYPIKYTWNYDAQRLAMWLRDNSAPGERYVCQHPYVMDLLSERKGYRFPITRDSTKLLDLLQAKQVRYVLVDKKKPKVQEFLLPVIEAHAEQFRLIREEEKASLYEFRLQG